MIRLRLIYIDGAKRALATATCLAKPSMVRLMDVQKQAAELSFEEKESLLAFLIHELPAPLSGADDEEVLRREEEMDSGAVEAISHEEFLNQVGRRPA
jgi:signal transduction histidine kinase